jgi:hypothetical protein
MLLLGIALIIIAVVCVGTGAALVLFGTKGPSAGASQATVGTSAPPPAASASASSASLRLLFRPNQDPQELAKQNIWRWFTFKIVNQNPATGQAFPIGTYIFLTFDPPVQTNYRRVFSPGHPELRFVVADLTARSMVITADNLDLEQIGATLEIQVSADPL